MSSKHRSRLRSGIWLFALLLGASHLLRALRGEPDFIEPGSYLHAVEVPVFDREGLHEGSASPGEEPETVKIVLEEFGPPLSGSRGGVAAPLERRPVVLLHGSPGRRNDLAGVAEVLGAKRATVRPDLPGFGRSTRHVPDYSVFAHAHYVRALCDELGIDRFHVVGFSMGGGVAIALTELCPERVVSVTLLAAIGVQEHELLGSYELNHLIHGLQLSVLWGLHEFFPHFGLLDQSILSVQFARNFFDTDQRPLRGMLEAWEGPLSILHGPTDVLVPLAAAEEHARIVPQAELALFDGGHFIPFVEARAAGEHLDDFFDRVEAGTAPTRATADPARIARSREPFDPMAVPAVSGFGLVFFGILIMLATLVSEDLTCIAVGMLVEQGRIGFWPGVTACVLGIYMGDLLLFLAGRWIGRGTLHRAPLRWFLNEQRVRSSSAWLERRGPLVIFLSRFLPGARLPTYFASGILRTSFWSFSLWFALAAMLWTPILVWISGQIGGAITDRVRFLEENLLTGLAVSLAVVFVLLKIVRPLLSRRGRRELVGKWKRVRNYEFWPLWVFYLPVVFYCAWRALLERRLLAFTAANPGIPHSGVIGESKTRILELVQASAPEVVPAMEALPAEVPAGERKGRVLAFLERHGLDLPVVVKPDVGERGEGVRIVRAEAELDELFAGRGGPAREGAWIVQRFVEGVEYGLFYAREPDQEVGELFSITRKDLPRVVGDGVHGLGELVLRDPRTVAQAAFLLEKNEGRLEWVAEAGEVVVLGDIGSHCRGTLFTDGAPVRTPELEAALDRVASRIPGFHLGRFDVKSPDEASLRSGRFQVIELNGVTSEAGEAYDPRYSVFQAWGKIMGQWRRSYRIGAMNARRGARVTGVVELLSLLLLGGSDPGPSGGQAAAQPEDGDPGAPAPDSPRMHSPG